MKVSIVEFERWSNRVKALSYMLESLAISEDNENIDPRLNDVLLELGDVANCIGKEMTMVLDERMTV